MPIFASQVEDALAANADVVLRIDVQGAATVRGMTPGAVSIFLVRRQPSTCDFETSHTTTPL